MTDPLDFLKQSNLHEDYLCRFEEIIRRTSHRGDFIVSQILIWSIINYVPLCQFKRGQIHILFYEDMFNDPIGELLRVRQFIHPKDDNRKIVLDEGVLRESRNRYDKKNNIINGTSPITSWKNELTTRQIDAGLDILNHFGFDQLYDDDLLPNRSVITDIHKN